MASAAEKLSLADFERKYGQSEQSYEYWNGKALPKASPTWIHGLLEAILLHLLLEAGYKCGSEVELRSDPDFRPKHGAFISGVAADSRSQGRSLPSPPIKFGPPSTAN